MRSGLFFFAEFFNSGTMTGQQPKPTDGGKRNGTWEADVPYSIDLLFPVLNNMLLTSI